MEEIFFLQKLCLFLYPRIKIFFIWGMHRYPPYLAWDAPLPFYRNFII